MSKNWQFLFFFHVMQGYLRFKVVERPQPPNRLVASKLYWFVLNETSLTYWTKKPVADESAIDVIHGIESATASIDSGCKRLEEAKTSILLATNTADSGQDRLYLLTAATEEDTKAWLKAIQTLWPATNQDHVGDEDPEMPQGPAAAGKSRRPRSKSQPRIREKPSYAVPRFPSSRLCSPVMRLAKRQLQ